jgi:hypothetical protein
MRGGAAATAPICHRWRPLRGAADAPRGGRTPRCGAVRAPGEPVRRARRCPAPSRHPRGHWPWGKSTIPRSLASGGMSRPAVPWDGSLSPGRSLSTAAVSLGCACPEKPLWPSRLGWAAPRPCSIPQAGWRSAILMGRGPSGATRMACTSLTRRRCTARPGAGGSPAWHGLRPSTEATASRWRPRRAGARDLEAAEPATARAPLFASGRARPLRR